MALHIMVLNMADICIYAMNRKNIDHKWKRNSKINTGLKVMAKTKSTPTPMGYQSSSLCCWNHWRKENGKHTMLNFIPTFLPPWGYYRKTNWQLSYDPYHTEFISQLNIQNMHGLRTLSYLNGDSFEYALDVIFISSFSYVCCDHKLKYKQYKHFWSDPHPPKCA